MSDATAPELTFGTAPVPSVVSHRETAPNPFDGKFPVTEGVAADKPDTEALTVTLPGKDDDTLVKRVKSQARKAANTIGRTARIQSASETKGTGKNAKTETVLTIWTVPQIKRPRVLTPDGKRSTDAPAE